MIGEPLEAWHEALAKLPVTLVEFTWDTVRGLPLKIVLDIELRYLSSNVTRDMARTRRRRHAPPPVRLVLENFGHGLGGRMFSVFRREERYQGHLRHLFSTGNLHNLIAATASRIDTSTLDSPAERT